jgi:hypothetical protein
VYAASIARFAATSAAMSSSTAALGGTPAMRSWIRRACVRASAPTANGCSAASATHAVTSQRRRRAAGRGPRDP